MEPRRNLVKGIDNSEIQIIGVEFTVTTYSYGRQELYMFSPTGLIIPRMRSGQQYGELYRPAITFHTTDGDYTLDDLRGNCPW